MAGSPSPCRHRERVTRDRVTRDRVTRDRVTRDRVTRDRVTEPHQRHESLPASPGFRLTSHLPAMETKPVATGGRRTRIRLRWVAEGLSRSGPLRHTRRL